MVSYLNRIWSFDVCWMLQQMSISIFSGKQWFLVLRLFPKRHKFYAFSRKKDVFICLLLLYLLIYKLKIKIICYTYTQDSFPAFFFLYFALFTIYCFKIRDQTPSVYDVFLPCSRSVFPLSLKCREIYFIISI